MRISNGISRQTKGGLSPSNVLKNTSDSGVEANWELQTQQDALLSGVKESGGLLRLWAKAAQWGTSPDTPVRWRQDFRAWWLRAANAKGHGRWLRTELTQDYGRSISFDESPNCLEHMMSRLHRGTKASPYTSFDD